jgi:anti-anti-sigma regulatory factor
MVLNLEEQLADPRLRRARVWELDMSGLARLGMPCAYALLRAATTAPEPIELHVRGVRRTVRRILHAAGVDAVAIIED